MRRSLITEQNISPAKGQFLERVVPLWVPFLVGLCGVVALIIFGATVRSAAERGENRGIVFDIVETPLTLKHLWRRYVMRQRFEAFADRIRYPAPVKAGFRRNTAQAFVDPGYELLTAYSEPLRRPVIRLIRLSDGRIMREYRPDIEAINARSHFRSALINLNRDRNVHRNLMMHPLPMADGGLIIHDSSPLARVDACGRVMWVIDGIFNHSVEPAPDGSIFAVYRYPRSPMPAVGPKFDDEAIAHVSVDGKLISLQRMADILDRGGLGWLWRTRPYVDDPFHVNEIEPVPSSGPYWQSGDLFVSLRNLSLILLYRPSTGQIIWSKIGPWAMQHDVHVVDNQRISIFDNHWRFAAPEGEVDGNNRVAIYDFATRKVSFPYAAAIRRQHIATRAQGRQRPMPDGDLIIEETEGGRLLRMSADGTVRWEYFNADGKGRRLQLRWSRYLDPVAGARLVQSAESIKCS